MNELVPDDWKVSTLGDCCSVLDSQRIPLNSQDRAKRKGVYPYYGANGVQGYIDDYIFEGDAILLAEDGGYFDEYAHRPIANFVTGRFWVNNHAHILRSKNETQNKWIYYCLVHKNITKHINGGTRSKLNQSDLKEIQIPVPPVPEQQKIAAILTSVDEVIEKSQAQIDKLQDLKKATMNQLLTRGINHTEFKDSPLGKIPKDWEVKKLGELSRNGINNGVFCDPKKIGRGYRLINVVNMYKGFSIKPDTLKLLDVDEKEFSKNKVEKGDVFFTRSSLKLEGIAYCNINLSESDDLTYDGHIMKVSPNSEIINAEFLANYCLSNFARTYFMRAAKHSTMTTIGQQDIFPLPVAVPPMNEQFLIVEIIKSISTNIEQKQRKLEQTKALKKSLMQDLLTGKKRVKVG